METALFQQFMDQLGELSGAQRQVLSEAIALGGAGIKLLEKIDTRFLTGSQMGQRLGSEALSLPEVQADFQCAYRSPSGTAASPRCLV